MTLNASIFMSSVSSIVNLKLPVEYNVSFALLLKIDFLIESLTLWPALILAEFIYLFDSI